MKGVSDLEYSSEMLAALERQHLRMQYARITLLDFETEDQIKVIEGDITSGNLSVNGSSRVRRTISLTMLATIDNSNLEDINNEISVNKKIRVEVGYKNYLKDYQEYGEILWFPCGVYVLSAASIKRATNGWTISITGKDKMCLLDGTAGGTLPASTTFHESLILLDNGDYEINYPTIFQIIYEAVNHWGGEAIENIIITDIDDQIKMLVKYIGDEPIYFNNDFSAFSFKYNKDEGYTQQVSYGENAGYQYTDFTYPGELILSAGDTVVTLLDKIVSVLGNYEYYYDLDGRFIFQEIKNYLNTGSPLLELEEEDYVRSYDNAKFLYSLTDLDTTTAISASPKYDNTKNDFYVWGTRTTAAGTDVAIRYHLAIDTKPNINLAGQYMYAVVDDDFVIRYEFSETEQEESENMKLISIPCTEWREELYRLALQAQSTNSVYDNYYDAELIAEWRNLYDPMNKNWKTTNNWNPDVFNNPENLNYWLDFIDTSSALGDYSVKRIGRRTKVINNDKVKTVYNKDVPDIIFVKQGELDDTKKNEMNSYGQKWFQLTDQVYDYFSISSTGTSCYDQIREMMYQNLCYNTTITLTCLPKYYIEPNNIIYIEDKESNIYGNYQITQYSLPLTYNGTMSITATQVLTRV